MLKNKNIIKEKLLNYMRGYFNISESEEAIIYITYLVWNAKFKMNKKFDKLETYEDISRRLVSYTRETEKYVLNICNKYLPRFGDEKFIQIIRYLNTLKEEDLIYIITQNYDESMKFAQSTPKEINELVYKILETVEGNNILDMCSYKGGFLVDYAKKSPKYNYSGIELNYNNIELAKIKFLALEKDFKFYQEDALNLNNDYKQKFDKIFCDHPFNIKYNDINYFNKNNILDFEFKKGTNSDWLYLVSVLKNLKENGKACILMFTNGLNKTSELELRKELIEKGYIETVIELPYRTLKSTFIKVTILVLSRNNNKVKFINADKMFNEKNKFIELDVDKIFEQYLVKEDNEFTKIVNKEEISKNNYNFGIYNYFDNEEVELKNAKKLEEVANEMIRGYQVYNKDQEENKNCKKYDLVNYNNIENGKLTGEFAKLYLDDDNKIDRYILKENDIIFPYINTKVDKICVIDKENANKYIANGNFIIIRLNQDILKPEYLKMYFESDKFEKVLKKAKSGRIIVRILMKDLKEMLVSVPTIEEQEKSLIKYLAKKDEIKIMKNKLLRLESNLEDIINNEF